MDSHRDAEYVSLASPATWAKVLLLVACAIDAAAALTSFSLLQLVDEAQQTGSLTLFDAETAESRHTFLRTLQLGAYAVGGLVFVWWFQRAYANLRAISVDGARHHPAWAVGAWLVPVAALVWPKRIADEIWRGSNPGADPKAGKAPALYGAWWRTFIVAGVLVAGGSALWSYGGTLTDQELGALLQVVGNLFGVASAVLALLVVDRTSKRQQARAARLADWRASTSP